MVLELYQLALADNDPAGTSDMSSTGGGSYIVTELRDIKATLRSATLVDGWWKDLTGLINVGGSAGPLLWTRLSSTTARIQGNHTAVGSNFTGYLVPGVRIATVDNHGFRAYGFLTASSFSGGDTTCTFIMDSGSLPSQLLNVIIGPNPRNFLPSNPQQILTGGGGAYGTASLALTNVDVSNLSQAVPIPVGFRLTIRASGDVVNLGGTVSVAITDGVTSLHEVLIGQSLQVPFSLIGTVLGDGATHTIALKWKVSAGTASMGNSGIEMRRPQMMLELLPGG